MRRPLLALLAAAHLVACSARDGRAPETASREALEQARIAALHTAKCGACHLPVDPGTRSRPVIEAAMNRHHARAHLTERDWSAMVAYLAARPEPAP